MRFVRCDGILLYGLLASCVYWFPAAAQCDVQPCISTALGDRVIAPYDSTMRLCDAPDCSTHFGYLALTVIPAGPIRDTLEAVGRLQFVPNSLVGQWDSGYIYLVRCTLSTITSRPLVERFVYVYNLVPMLPEDRCSPSIFLGSGFSEGSLDTSTGQIWAAVLFVYGLDGSWIDSVLAGHADSVRTNQPGRFYILKGMPNDIRDLIFVDGVFYVGEADTTPMLPTIARALSPARLLVRRQGRVVSLLGRQCPSAMGRCPLPPHLVSGIYAKRSTKGVVCRY